MKKISLLLISVMIFATSCKKETTTSSGKYYPQVKAIVQANCTVSCHSPSKGFYQGLPVILETDSNIVQDAALIKASVADPTTFTNKRMPQTGSLSASDINIIVQWYANGGGTSN